MKTYEIRITLIWKAESDQKAMDECHDALVSLENLTAPGGYQGYRDMRVREIPSKPDTSA